MRLKKLEITGFKSFHDKTRIVFPPGVSAVVGPNGCGKSNIVDALRWVMGEQSARQLRGKKMEDIIFAGADGKPPLNMAEVSLTLDNDDQSVPDSLKEFTEIMITRRLYRSGETGYFINRQPCRMKDIHNIFLGSGTGKNSFAVIGQGNIGSLTDATPEERRYFIEDAADVTKYKSSKKETLAKLKSTGENLTRISDIISELAKQMTGLKHQAHKAEKYQSYRARIKELDIMTALIAFDELSSAIGTGSCELAKHKDQEAHLFKEIGALEAATEEIKVASLEKSDLIAGFTAARFETQRDMDKYESRLEHLKKQKIRLHDELIQDEQAIKDVGRKNETLSIEIKGVLEENSGFGATIEGLKEQLQKKTKAASETKETLDTLKNSLREFNRNHMELVSREARQKNILATAKKNIETIARRLKLSAEERILSASRVKTSENDIKNSIDEIKCIDDEVSGLKEALTEQKSAITAGQALLNECNKESHALEIERGKRGAHLKTLKKMEENFEWYEDGVRALMKKFPAGDNNGISGILADMLTTETGYETAVAAALGDTLQYLMVETLEGTTHYVDYLKASESGRCGFIPPLPRNNKPHLPPGFDPSKKLIHHVTARHGFEDTLHNLLGNILLADNLIDALKLHDTLNGEATIVTLAGEIISERGILTGGGEKGSHGILSKKLEMQELEERIRETEQKQASVAAKIKEHEAALEEKKTEHAKYEEELRNALADRTEAEKELAVKSERIKQAKKAHEIAEQEHEQFSGEEIDLEDEISKSGKTLAAITAEIESAGTSSSDTTDQIDALSKRYDEYTHKTVELKLTLAEGTTKQKSHLDNVNRLQKFLNEGTFQKERLEQEINRKKRESVETIRNIERFETELKKMYETFQTREKELEKSGTDFTLLETRTNENQKKLKALSSSLAALRETYQKIDMELVRLKTCRDNISNRIEEHYHHPVENFRDEVPLTAGTSLEVLEKELANLKSRMNRLGDVNHGAISEYEELKIRYEFLTTQHNDLVKAIEDLESIIKKINRITQEKFITTFNQINEKLGELFPRLFEGGSAKLVLTEPSNPLETGVEFMIQPPGKKLTRLSLLSGGEKALSAIAFVFSIFLMKPSSFCIMDEIDAPLDDANVYRFNNLIKMIGEQSQILIITHKQITMEFADILFGVTMEKKGVSKIVSVDFNQAIKTDNEAA